MAKEIPWKILSEAYAFCRQLAAQADDDDVDGGVGSGVLGSVSLVRRRGRGGGRRGMRALCRRRPSSARKQAKTSLSARPSNTRSCSWARRRPRLLPWETMYRGENVTVGFGQATFEMRELLREAGLEVRNVNDQYEDHLGIELLPHLVAVRPRRRGRRRCPRARIRGGLHREASAQLGRRVPREHRRGGTRRLLRLACRVGSSSARLACRSAARVGGSHGLPCNDRFARGFGHRRQRR